MGQTNKYDDDDDNLEEEEEKRGEGWRWEKRNGYRRNPVSSRRIALGKATLSRDTKNKIEQLIRYRVLLVRKVSDALILSWTRGTQKLYA